jgi:hypothetical protein
MYYTDTMRRAFRSVPLPNDKLKLEVIDNDDFLTLKLYLEPLLKMTGEERKESVIYTLMVKEALEQAGATVLVVRDAEPK